MPAASVAGNAAVTDVAEDAVTGSGVRARLTPGGVCAPVPGSSVSVGDTAKFTPARTSVAPPAPTSALATIGGAADAAPAMTVSADTTAAFTIVVRDLMRPTSPRAPPGTRLLSCVPPLSSAPCVARLRLLEGRVGQVRASRPVLEVRAAGDVSAPFRRPPAAASRSFRPAHRRLAQLQTKPAAPSAALLDP